MQIAWNDSFIYVLQYPLTLRKGSGSYTYPNPDESAWWIVDVKEKKTIGPLTKEAFDAKIGGTKPLNWMTPKEVKGWGQAHNRISP